MCRLLALPDYGAIASELTIASDIELLLDFILYVRSTGLIWSPVDVFNLYSCSTIVACRLRPCQKQAEKPGGLCSNFYHRRQSHRSLSSSLVLQPNWVHAVLFAWVGSGAFIKANIKISKLPWNRSTKSPIGVWVHRYTHLNGLLTLICPNSSEISREGFLSRGIGVEIALSPIYPPAARDIWSGIATIPCFAIYEEWNVG